jgi:6-carboxyhexanoate--CoA ligase
MIDCAAPSEAETIIADCLDELGVSRKAQAAARAVLRGRATMRGAALIDLRSGKRLEPDRSRGVRVSLLGISPDADRGLRRRLSRRGINTDTVREALVLASKVAACPAIVAEVCISDDPDYTTGYVASSRTGYLRIPAIKEFGSPAGGRVFFVKSGTTIDPVINYLEEQPVIIT